MEVIELKPIRDKKIILYLINIESIIGSKNEIAYIYNTLDEFDFTFITVDLKNENSNQYAHDLLLKLSKIYKKPFFSLDIPEYVKKGIYKEISRHNEQIEELELECKVFNHNQIERKSFNSQDLESWINYLKTEVKTIENYLNLKVRPQWIVKGMLELIEMYDEKDMYIMHFTTGLIFAELKRYLKQIEITVIPYDIREKYSKSQQIV
ncbi:MAG: hypothetical protein ACFFCM_08615 [Promethearchaeota archaeon]